MSAAVSTTVGPDEQAARNRRIRIVLGLLLVVAAGATVWSYRTSQRHDAAINRVVLAVSAFDGRADHTALRAAHDDAVAAAGSGMDAVFDSLTVEIPEPSPFLLAPVEVTGMGTSLVVRYPVETAGRRSCVISVLREDGGYRVEAIPDPCANAELNDGLRDAIGS